MYEIGKHKFECKSIETLDVGNLLQGRKANVLYSDPPWNAGNIKYWATMNKKMTGEEFKPLSFEDLISTIGGIIKNHVDGYVFLEVGIKQAPEIVSQLGDIIHNAKIHEVLYKGGGKWTPNAVISASTQEVYNGFNLDLTGTKCDGPILPDRCLGNVATKGDLILDPFCGLGNTGKACIKWELEFRGNEFNSARLNRTMLGMKQW